VAAAVVVDGIGVVDVPGLHADARNPSAAVLAPLSTVRRSTLDESSHSVPPTNTPLAPPREAQSSGPPCEGGRADARGLIISSVAASGPRRHAACRRTD